MTNAPLVLCAYCPALPRFASADTRRTYASVKRSGTSPDAPCLQVDLVEPGAHTDAYVAAAWDAGAP
jgi:hypothetical protein